MQRPWMLLIALLGTVATAYAAEAYRWVDANGVVHYSDSPPPVTSKAEVVRLPGTKSPAATAATPADAEAKATDLEDADDSGAKKEPGKLASEVQSAEKRCAAARSNLEVLQRSGPVGFDSGAGKPKPLDDAARRQQISSAQTIIATYCK